MIANLKILPDAVAKLEDRDIVVCTEVVAFVDDLLCYTHSSRTVGLVSMSSLFGRVVVRSSLRSAVVLECRRPSVILEVYEDNSLLLARAGESLLFLDGVSYI